MDRDILRLIILIIGLLVMAGHYYFDPSRRQKTGREKPWYAEGEDSSEYSDTDEYVRVVKTEDYSADNQHLYEEQEFDQQPEQSFQRKAGQYSSISELVIQSKPPENTELESESQPTTELDPELKADSFANNSEVIKEERRYSEFDNSHQQRRFSDRLSDEEFFSPLSMDWAENVDSELEINAALLEPLGDPDPAPETTEETGQIERPTILMLYLVNTGDIPYQGEEITKAFAKAGLSYGSMDLFHYVDYQQNKELFSVSNMREPGTFPEQMTYLEVEGMILFMQPMTLSNPADTYEKMITCADTLYTELGGQILDETRQPITQAYLDQQRQWLTS
jgi:cell division protein ZipA